ncbi:MAG: VPLPA-CTERM sorting domain-containing protein [Pseudomonadota bacterium]
MGKLLAGLVAGLMLLPFSASAVTFIDDGATIDLSSDDTFIFADFTMEDTSFEFTLTAPTPFVVTATLDVALVGVSTADASISAGGATDSVIGFSPTSSALEIEFSLSGLANEVLTFDIANLFGFGVAPLLSIAGEAEVADVPLPQSAFLFLASIAGLAILARRRRMVV